MVLKALVAFVATLGVGKIPMAPGTWGSLLAAVIWWVCTPLSGSLQVLLVVSAFFIGGVATHFYEKWSHQHDPKEVVVDELVGMWVTLLGVPQVGWLVPWFFILGFLLFRLFDIWKPLPIGWIDRRVPGAFGTMLDDVVAGVFAGLALAISAWMISQPMPVADLRELLFCKS